MSSLKKSITLSHNAYCLTGGSFVHDEVLSVLKKDFKINSQGNPDIFDREYRAFTIDDAREIKMLHEVKPVTALGKKIFILAMDNITVEAQNALLKLLEEPAEYAHFFLIIPSVHLLLPTVKSRLSIIETENENVTKEVNNEAHIFVSSSATKRLEQIKKLVDDITKEKRTKREAIDFLNEIEAVIHKEKGIVNGKGPLEAINLVKKYINDRSPSLKMLLEYVALNI